MTTIQTLCRESGSFLARLSQEDRSLPSEKDESGFYLIDRDSDYFSSVLNYLRHGKVILDHGLSEEGIFDNLSIFSKSSIRNPDFFLSRPIPVLTSSSTKNIFYFVYSWGINPKDFIFFLKGLREEAEFYNLPKLIALCKERIADRERQRKSLVFKQKLNWLISSILDKTCLSRLTGFFLIF